jgi:hypothetical protein
MSSLRSCGPLTYSNNKRAKQLHYALDDHVWGMKITALEKSADFVTLDTEKLFNKLKSHELSHKGRLNHDTSLTSKVFITSAPTSTTTPNGMTATTRVTIRSTASERRRSYRRSCPKRVLS